MSNFGLVFGALLLFGGFYFVELRYGMMYIGNAVNKDFPGMCFHNDTQTPIKIGSTITPKSQCVQLYCREDFVLGLLYCPPYMIGEGCTVTFKKDTVYPDCCANIDCSKASSRDEELPIIPQEIF